jgi:hypothetical protein
MMGRLVLDPVVHVSSRCCFERRKSNDLSPSRFYQLALTAFQSADSQTQDTGIELRYGIFTYLSWDLAVVDHGALLWLRALKERQHKQ